MGKSHTFEGHALEGGSRIARAAVRREAVVSEIVGHDQDDIRQSADWRDFEGGSKEKLLRAGPENAPFSAPT